MLKRGLSEKFTAVIDYLRGLRRVAVMLSGGVDSSLLTALAKMALSDVVAVTVKSPLTFNSDIRDACRVAELLGVQHSLVEVNELVDYHVSLNTPLRCYKCKKIRVKAVKEWLLQRGALDFEIVEGVNSDEAPTRPGLRALKEEGVHTPFVDLGVGKQDIRLAAARLGIPTASKPPNSCRATRIEEFTPLSEELLEEVEDLEEELKGLVGDVALRARLSRGCVRIEVPEEVMQRLLEFKLQVQDVVEKRGFKWASLSLKPYTRR